MSDEYKSYKISILYDSRDTWTESARSSFLRVAPFYVKTLRNDFVEKICMEITKIILKNENLEEDGLEEDDFCLEMGYMKDGSLDETFVDVETTKNLYEFLKTHHKYAVYQMSSGKYWSRIYISIVETDDTILCVELTGSQIRELLNKRM
jgi:hypothetical protein